ncbi:MAG TPA: family 78 glycoside hydrolase catalytic domain [Microbacteriaceae bacterium]|nr:family 78 glycoside hydrolase catalytic domain [Microbacteriaceae bacterium]
MPLTTSSPSAASPSAAWLSVASVRAGRRSDSATVAQPRPVLSWKTVSSSPNWEQARAELRLVDLQSGDEQLASVDGSDSVSIDWPFADLRQRDRATLSVRVFGHDGSASEWSEPVTIFAGFLGEDEWNARFIGVLNPSESAQPALLRTEFEVTGPVREAVLYATAHGVYQAEVNGREVDEEVLKPGWTPYQFRLIHETTDVTTLLNQGPNAIGFALAGGWFTEKFGFGGLAKTFYGDQPAIAGQLLIRYEDGSTQWVLTDDSWRVSTDGPVISSGIYAGESYDRTREQTGWSSAGFAASGWAQPRVLAPDEAAIIPEARTSPAVRRIEEVPAREIITTPSGKTVIDFGQNLVGRIRLTVRGERGSTVTLRHAEVLEHDELGTRPLRFAAATDHYTLRGGSSAETWEPSFTFHGFRYAQIDGLAQPPRLEDVVAIVIHSDMERTGWFESSDPLINQLYSNVVWGMRGNFLSLPTDCPQRDERLGWTGDIQVFSPSASYLYDSDSFLSSWLHDLWLEQRAANGVVPFVVPDVLGSSSAPTAAWGDAATVVPWTLYQRFGDLEVLRAQFDSMKAWADQLIAVSGEQLLWEGQFQFGDWLDPDAPFDDAAKAKVDPDIVATAHLFRSTDLVAKAARVLGDESTAAQYEKTAEAVRTAFLAAYVAPSGRIVSDATTAYAMAIAYGIATDPELRAAMGNRLAYLVRASGYHISTGFVGTPIIQDALTSTGHLNAAERLLTQTEEPSWLYPVTMGATTIWERWDSMLEDGSINPGEMTSFNHYAFGAVTDWLDRVVAGLAPAEPGYRTIRIAPTPLASLSFARAEHETPYGRASVGWKRNDDGSIIVEAVVPTGARAEVILPGSVNPLTVGSGEHSWIVESQSSTAELPAVSTSSSLADIIDDREAYRAVLDVIERHDPQRAARFRKHTKWIAKRRLIDDFTMLPPEIEDEITRALGELQASRDRR